MKLILLAQILLIFGCHAPLAHSDASILNSTHRWYANNQEEIHLQIKEKINVDETAPIINSLGLMIELNDGAILAEISETIAVVLVEKPALMLSWFDNHPKSLEVWASFVESGFLSAETANKAVKLKKLRQDTIISLQNVDASLTSARLLKAFENSDVRLID